MHYDGVTIDGKKTDRSLPKIIFERIETVVVRKSCTDIRITALSIWGRRPRISSQSQLILATRISKRDPIFLTRVFPSIQKHYGARTSSVRSERVHTRWILEILDSTPAGRFRRKRTFVHVHDRLVRSHPISGKSQKKKKPPGTNSPIVRSRTFGRYT